VKPTPRAEFEAAFAEYVRYDTLRPMPKAVLDRLRLAKARLKKKPLPAAPGRVG